MRVTFHPPPPPRRWLPLANLVPGRVYKLANPMTTGHQRFLVTDDRSAFLVFDADTGSVRDATKKYSELLFEESKESIAIHST